jgi:hypothetical protein
MYLTILDFSTASVDTHWIEETEMDTIDCNQDDSWFIDSLGYDSSYCNWMFHHSKARTNEGINK